VAPKEGKPDEMSVYSQLHKKSIGTVDVVWRDGHRVLLRKTQDGDDEQLIDQIRKSLTTDHRRGYRLPNHASCEAASKRNVHTFKVEDGVAQQEENRLEIDLLPPVNTMTALQKRMVQQQLEFRVRARKRLARTINQVATGGCFLHMVSRHKMPPPPGRRTPSPAPGDVQRSKVASVQFR
jgi:hypothetical protein